MSKRTAVELTEPEGVVHVVPHPTEADVWIVRSAAEGRGDRAHQKDGAPMTPERMERLRDRSERAMRSGRGTVEHRQAMQDRRDLLAEVDRLRAALARIVDDSGDAYHHARRALEGTP